MDDISGGTVPQGSRSLTIDRVFATVSILFVPKYSIVLFAGFWWFLRSTDLSVPYALSIVLGIAFALNALYAVDRVYSAGSIFRPKFLWPEQIVLITGGGSGIGALLTKRTAALGGQVVILAKYLPDKGVFSDNLDKIHIYECDVSNYSAVKDVAARVQAEVGHPTIIINNAGVVKGKLLLDLTEEDVLDTFGANTLAHFWILKGFLPDMLKRGRGHIVNMSSVMGLVGSAQMTDYCASKAALVNLHQSLRFELDNRYKTPNIKTTLVLPALIQTTLFSKVAIPSNWFMRFLAPALEPETVVEAILEAIKAQESRVIRLPLYTQLARINTVAVGLVPTWLRDLLQRVAGADHAMKAYGPRPDAAERLEEERQRNAVN